MFAGILLVRLNLCGFGELQHVGLVEVYIQSRLR
jgi:hypothetical protein